LSAGVRRPALVRAALALALALGADCARGDFSSAFEAQCAALPPARYTVTADPITYRQGDTRSIDELTAMSGRAPGGRQLTMGLTTVSFGHQTRINVQSIEYAEGRRACATVDVVVNLTLQPLTVYLADELDASHCARAVTLEHEMKHVAVFRDTLAETQAELSRVLPAVLAPGAQRGTNTVELRERLFARIDAYVSDFMRVRQRILDERQAAVDSPAEYARVKTACQ
jgi:hypothetical protein